MRRTACGRRGTAYFDRRRIRWSGAAGDSGATGEGRLPAGGIIEPDAPVARLQTQLLKTVGQDGILRPIGNRPRVSSVRDQRRLPTAAQDTILPHGCQGGTVWMSGCMKCPGLTGVCAGVLLLRG